MKAAGVPDYLLPLFLMILNRSERVSTQKMRPIIRLRKKNISASMKSEEFAYGIRPPVKKMIKSRVPSSIVNTNSLFICENIGFLRLSVEKRGIIATIMAYAVNRRPMRVPYNPRRDPLEKNVTNLADNAGSSRNFM